MRKNFQSMDGQELWKWLREHFGEKENIRELVKTDFQNQYKEEVLKWVDEHFGADVSRMEQSEE